ncbi:MAG: glycerol kinase GlpK [candidate division KSB1 bacterium]|nr:glycerol kinase GlpK [candidate division KSB1 bacterium]MDZ7272915.1 glycerol kinase GlpK [candidate division KSB1 bacterium]MDZ7284063.1 glycerol kinase GlpK [candidate division KSB1 bacterium]MDZ7297540.1 glycerol kinase GlpK [candidate division KSB1 bacterium]MDZ7309112.1 glycerol kinase GlpK [candidate division KSB1 bacterium]
MKYLLALDQGTTSSRSIIFDQEGNMRAWSQQEFTQYYPQPGWVEHDPEEIWQTQLATARAALQKAGLSAKDIAAIGITNQRETTLLWERKTGKAVHPAIVWQDRRTAALCDEIRATKWRQEISRRTGLVADPYFSATKIKWLLDNVAGLRPRARQGELAFGTIDTWLLWKLTGGKVHATDCSNASRTLLFNIHECDWDRELLALFDIPAALLPKVRPSSGLFGLAAAEWLGAEIPIAGIAGDQQAALFGQTCFKPGMLKNTYGTGCFMLMQTGAQAFASQHGLLTTIAWQIGGGQVQYALEGSVFVAGAVVQWLRDELQIIKSASEIEHLAAQVKDNGGVYLVPAFAGLGSPYWDAGARGTIVGLTRGTNRGHLARAALEAIAYQSRDLAEAMQEDAGITLTELRVDGGAVGNDLLMQFQADIVPTPVVRPAVTETTALGAAYLAGLAVGCWRDLDDLSRHWRAQTRFSPSMPEAERRQLYHNWRRAVGRAAGWLQND